MNSKLRTKARITPSRTSASPEKTLLPDTPTAKLERLNKKISDSVDLITDKLEVILKRLDDLEKHTSLKEKHFPISEHDKGIFAYLRAIEYNVFSPRIICTQSSADLFSIIDPESPNYYGSPDKGDCWIQFDFQQPINVTGFQLQSCRSCFVKSYRITTFNDDLSTAVLYSTDAETGLNGQMQVVTHTFKKKRLVKCIRFEQTGKSWSDKNFIGIKHLDFMTDHTKNLLADMIQQSNGNPHRIPVSITAKYFDFSTFHTLHPNSYICTFDSPLPSWFQVEISVGKASIEGYRLHRHESLTMKSWTIKGTNNQRNPIEEWVTIHSVEEKAKGELNAVYSCNPSPPVKYIRLIMDGEGWNERNYLSFYHFEVFGKLFTEAFC
ncbi:hypothetical protein TRFO_39673 [Tritrichomonas foetus]|uniref:F5/8 type C domain-containing protein n=1 Tax=Tritrichomonas foetus TaxID=1144522 RepID=A0A1J4J3Y8_9EUKA|nr:hypothetical protein TRFO_39673 [Tritrichomonas foetus]|eukprot:OHS94142.1 hypothetical protein TRFO_39673 [Tritrichomonas foetus]